MRLRKVLTVTLAWLACVSSVVAEDDLSQTREKLAAGVEAAPMALRMDERNAPHLMAIFRDQTAPRHVRLRALSALSRMKRDDVRVFFTTLLSARADQAESKDELAPQRSALVLRRAIDALVRIEPSDRTVGLIASFLTHASVQVRAAVANALVRVRSERAERMAQARLSAEPSALVRRALLNVSARPPVP